MYARFSHIIRNFAATNVSKQHFMDKNNAYRKPQKATLAIINYEMANIELVTLDGSLLDEYADDYDRLVFGTLGYKPESVYYMIADNIEVIDNR